MASADIYEGKIRVETEFRERDLIKAVPGARYDGKDRVWQVPLSWASCVILRGVFKDKLVVGDLLSKWSWSEYKDRVEPALWLRSITELEPGQLPGLPYLANEDKLYPFQRAATSFIAVAQRALLASEMGLGKTVQAISALATWQEVTGDALPCLIVCTNTMKKVWEREFEVWAPHLNVTVVQGGKGQRDKQIRSANHVYDEDGDLVHERESDVIIMNWESIRNHTKLAGYGHIRLSDKEKELKELNEVEWATVISDETHRAKNPGAKQTRALWQVSKPAKYRLALTGTPVTNTPDDLWSIMHFLSPDEWPARTKYIDRFCLTSWNTFGGLEIVGIRPDTRDEFFKILDPRFKRDLKKAVLSQLPDKTYQERYVEMAPKQRKAYKQLAETMLAELDDGDSIFVTNPLARMIRLSQFACSYAELNEDGDVVLKEPSCKIDALMEIVEERGGAPLVVFAESRQLIELAEKRLEKNKIPYVSIRGGVSPYDREANVRRFQNREVPVLLGTLGAGGEGITLTAADTLVFLQRSWSLVKNKQAEDRIHRIGQDSDKVEIIDIIAQDTLEDDRLVKLAMKEDRLQEVVRDNEQLRRLLGGED